MVSERIKAIGHRCLVLSQWIGNDIEKKGIPTLKPLKKYIYMIEKKFQTIAKEKGPS